MLAVVLGMSLFGPHYIQSDHEVLIDRAEPPGRNSWQRILPMSRMGVGWPIGQRARTGSPPVGETGTRSVMGHILSVGFLKLSSVGTLLLYQICLSLLGTVWYYQKIGMTMTRFVKIGKVCFLSWKAKLFQANKTLFCDCLWVVVSVISVPGSRECPEYHTCIIVPKQANFFVKK